MKKLILSMFALAMTALTFTSCEDVPAPYDEPNGNNSTTPEAVVEPAGEGTEASPYNVAKALEVVKAGTQPTTDVYLKGIITSIKEIDTDKFGNASYYISDTKGGKTTFYIYRSKSFNNSKFTTGKEINVGDTVVVKGIIINYNGTPETDGNKSHLVSVNGKAGGTTPDTPSTSTTEPSGEGTEANPYNVAAIVAKVTAMAADVNSTEEYYIKGKVADAPSIDTGSYGNASFTLTDDGNNSFKIFRIYDIGNKKFTSSDAIKKGDEVVIRGLVVNYKGNTPETVQNKAYLVSVNGKTTPSEPTNNENNNTPTTVTGDLVVKATDMGFADKKPATSYTTNDVTFTFAQGEGASAPAYYGGNYAAVRMYAKNTMVIKASKKIAKVIITTSATFTSNGKTTICHGNEQAYATSGSNKVMINIESDTQVSFSGLDNNEISIVNDFTSNKGGNQLRIVSIAIVYAK